ncbi:hypothetical protein [Nocardia sp. N2S4-5]|uniref:hypothetical protein n=1 Tax=Nocardia sp. N2S4-5 TaxID=3351565 RepID=UPI0037D53829
MGGHAGGHAGVIRRFCWSSVSITRAAPTGVVHRPPWCGWCRSDETETLMVIDNVPKRDHRKSWWFEVVFSDWYPRGLFQIGPVQPDRAYSNDPNRPGPQNLDEATHLPLWKVAVLDPSEDKAKRKSFDVVIVSAEEPVPTTEELDEDMRRIQLDGLKVQPRITGTDQFKYLTWAVRATGFTPAPTSGRGNASTSGSGSGSRSEGGKSST